MFRQLHLRMLLGAFLLLVLIDAGAAPAGAQEWASSVVSFTPGSGDLGSVDLITNNPCRGSGRPLDLNDALGPPDSAFVSVGDEGIIVLTFPHPIDDLAGPDFRVWASCNVFCEPAMVSVSQNGQTFVDVGRLETFPFQAFDLAGTGLASAIYVRIRDLFGLNPLCEPGIGLATDVDTAENLHPGAPIATVPQSWGLVKILFR